MSALHSSKPPKQPRMPKISRHATGQGVVRLDGKDHYLGKFGSAEAQAKYQSIVYPWFLARKAAADAAAPPIRYTSDFHHLTINELVLRFIQFAEDHYREAPEINNLKLALRDFRAAFGKTLVREFGPKLLKEFMQRLLAPRFRRKRITDSDGEEKTIDQEYTLGQRTINQRVQRIIRMFKWATEEEIIPSGIHIASSLMSVSLLRNGRFGVKPPCRVLPARQEDLDKILPHLTPQVRAMVELIALTGMRSSDACNMRPIDIDRSGDVWKYRPRKFKRSAMDGQKPRIIYLGARAQAILQPFLEGRAPEANLFSPAEAMANLRASQKRRSGSKKRVVNPKRVPGKSYNSKALYSAVRSAAEKAGIREFFPNQLRHMAATNFRRLYGVEDAKILMGHGSISTTEIYAEQDAMRSIEIMREIG